MEVALTDPRLPARLTTARQPLSQGISEGENSTWAMIVRAVRVHAPHR
jgi:hypothetical protein